MFKIPIDKQIKFVEDNITINCLGCEKEKHELLKEPTAYCMWHNILETLKKHKKTMRKEELIKERQADTTIADLKAKTIDEICELEKRIENHTKWRDGLTYKIDKRGHEIKIAELEEELKAKKLQVEALNKIQDLDYYEYKLKSKGE
jgi:hypothetical protein